ncbi:MAG TPA: serine hydrolase [Ktedonobacterales bacterium]|nr:serine hydrolase [Ktedonobacterales bacterium]
MVGVVLALWVVSSTSSSTLATPTWASTSNLAPVPTRGMSGTPACPRLRADPTFGVSLIDVQTGQPLCEHNPEGIAQPASTTKVMAALLVGEYLQAHHLSLDTQVMVQPADLQVEPDAAVAGLRVGQHYSVRLLLAMASILSAADAVMALARFVAGSRAGFLALMNQQAQALGMAHTRFSSPYGYARTSALNWQQGENTSIGNYASAHDLAELLVAFARFPTLVTIFGLEHYEEAGWALDRLAGEVLPDFWEAYSPPFQVLVVKKGCMWCDPGLHKLSYVLLIQAASGQEIAAAFLYTTQDITNPQVGDVLAMLLWALHECQGKFARWCW